MGLAVAKLKMTLWRNNTPSWPEAGWWGIVNGCALYGQKQKKQENMQPAETGDES